MDWLPVVGFAAPLLVSLVAWIAVIRKSGGRIQTSEASDLWKAQEEMRGDLTLQLVQERERSVNLEIRMAKAETASHTLLRENWELQRKVNELETIVTAQAKTIASLEALVKSQREELEEK
jgi:hypothetical protein